MKTIRRRRFEAKTDYKARLALIKSEIPRIVVRKTGKYVIVQIVQTDVAQDKVVYGITSKVLLSKGWPSELSGSLKSLPACYLTGFVLGKSALEKGIKKVILDAGMYANVKGSRVYAVLKGAIDAGLEIPHSKDVLPEMERIKSEKVAKIFDKLLGGLNK